MDFIERLSAWDPAWNAPLGWGLVMLGIAWGGVLGLGFQRADFLGGYHTFPRRLLRLGHVACVALGAANVFWSTLEVPEPYAGPGGLAWACAGALMPACCALAALDPRFRHAFPLPVSAAACGALMGMLA